MSTQRTPWRIVGLLCATATASYICRVNVSTAGAMLMSEFGLSQVAMGRVFSAFLLGYALFQVPAGALADRWGARRVLALSAWLWVAVTSMQAMMMRIARTSSGTAGGIMNMGSNLGGLLSPALTPILAASIGWENALHVAAILSMIAAVLWLGVHPAGRDGD